MECRQKFIHVSFSVLLLEVSLAARASVILLLWLLLPIWLNLFNSEACAGGVIRGRPVCAAGASGTVHASLAPNTQSHLPSETGRNKREGNRGTDASASVQQHCCFSFFLKSGAVVCSSCVCVPSSLRSGDPRPGR